MDKADIYFFKKLAEKYNVINLIWQPDGKVDGNRTINAFYKNCIEEDTIYFKLDDDIVWMEPSLITKMVDFRIDNPEYFLVSPLVINNALCTYILEIKNKIKLRRYLESSASHPILWRSGKFASCLHDWFINKYLIPDKYYDLYCGKLEIGMTRFSINAVLWFGHQMKAFGGIIPDNPGDDEEFLSCIYPSSIGSCNSINGDAVISHFAFFTQRKELDRQSILDRYGRFLHECWKKDKQLGEIDFFVQDLMQEIKEKKEKINNMEIPYEDSSKTKGKSTFVQKREKFLRYIIPVEFYDRIMKSRLDRMGSNFIIE